MFIVALFVLGKKWKQLKYLLIIEQINKIWYSYSVNVLYIALKSNLCTVHHIHLFFITTISLELMAAHKNMF